MTFAKMNLSLFSEHFSFRTDSIIPFFCGDSELCRQCSPLSLVKDQRCFVLIGSLMPQRTSSRQSKPLEAFPAFDGSLWQKGAFHARKGSSKFLKIKLDIELRRLCRTLGSEEALRTAKLNIQNKVMWRLKMKYKAKYVLS